MNGVISTITHIGFNVSLIVKGIFALSEILCGISLSFLNPDRMTRLVNFITKKELHEDPADFFLNYIVRYANAYSISSQHFAMFYLITHGTFKMIVLVLLWRRKHWAFPLAIIVFIGFIVYQLYHFSKSHSPMLIVLSVFDMAMVLLIALEYRRKLTLDLQEKPAGSVM